MIEKKNKKPFDWQVKFIEIPTTCFVKMPTAVFYSRWNWSCLMRAKFSYILLKNHRNNLTKYYVRFQDMLIYIDVIHIVCCFLNHISIGVWPTTIDIIAMYYLWAFLNLKWAIKYKMCVFIIQTCIHIDIVDGAHDHISQWHIVQRIEQNVVFNSKTETVYISFMECIEI